MGARLLFPLGALIVALGLAAPIAAQAQAGAQDQAPAESQPDGTLEGGVVEGEPGEEIEDDGLPRVVLAAFTTEGELPSGRTRVARLHVRVQGTQTVDWNVELTVAGSREGQSIQAAVELLR